MQSEGSTRVYNRGNAAGALVLGAACLMAVAPCRSATQAPTSVVRVAKLEVHETMSPDSSVTSVLRQGDKVVVGLEMQTGGQDWCEVSNPVQGDRLGYVPCEALQRPPRSPEMKAAEQAALNGVVLVLEGKAQAPQGPPTRAATRQKPDGADRRFLTSAVVAPDFTLSGLDGSTHSLSEFRGHYVLLDFWASWCGPCRMEMPRLDRLQQEYAASGLEIVGINSGEAPARVRQFIQQTGYRYRILLDPQDQASARYDVRALPTLVVVDPEGNVRFYDAGAYDTRELRAALARVGLR